MLGIVPTKQALQATIPPMAGQDGGKETVSIVRFSGDLDLMARERLEAAVDSLAGADIAVIDLTRVPYADSTFLNAVARLYQKMEARQRPFAIRIVKPASQVRRIFNLTQLDRYVEFWDSLESAKSSGIVRNP